MNAITQQEKEKYYQIFVKRGQVNGYMPGDKARDVLLDSGLDLSQLERIWDLADIDKDGNLDFDEFCVAMRLTYDCINGVEIPNSLGANLVPPTKAHLLPHLSGHQPSTAYQQAQPTGFQQTQLTGYQPAQTTGYQQSQPTGFQNTGYQQTQPTGYQPQLQASNYQQPQLTGFQNQQQPQYTGVPSPSSSFQQQQQQLGYPQSSVTPQMTGMNFSARQKPTEFSWRMTPLDLSKYEGIYSNYKNSSGKVKFNQLSSYCQTLNLGRNDLSDAWSLVDVNHTNTLNQDQCLLFLHILNQCNEGAPMPDELPADLQRDLSMQPGERQGPQRDKPPSESAKLADSYVNRLGVASTSLSSPGSSSRADKYDEEEMLKRELANLKEKVKEAEVEAENAKRNGPTNGQFSSQPLIDQFQALLDYKTRQLTAQNDIDEKIRRQERDIAQAQDTVRRLEGMRDNLRSKKTELETLLEERRREVQKAIKA